MANPNHISNSNPAAILGEYPVSCHHYDNWLIPASCRSPEALFASAVLDVSQGAKSIASILAAHLVDLNVIASGGKNVKPLLNPVDTEALARLAVFSLDKLHEMATDQVDRFNAASEEGASK